MVLKRVMYAMQLCCIAAGIVAGGSAATIEYKRRSASAFAQQFAAHFGVPVPRVEADGLDQIRYMWMIGAGLVVRPERPFVPTDTVAVARRRQHIIDMEPWWTLAVSVDGLRFGIAHEVCHIWLGHTRFPARYPWTVRLEEWQAHACACKTLGLERCADGLLALSENGPFGELRGKDKAYALDYAYRNFFISP